MHDYKYEVKEKVKNKIKIEVKLDFAEYEKYEQDAIKRLAKSVKVAGFRPGKAPADMVQSQVASKAMNNAINSMLPHMAEHILSDEKMNPIAPIDYDLKELDKEKGVIFEMEFYNHPEIKAEQFKSLKVEEKDSKVEDEEVMEVIRNMISSNLPKKEVEESDSKNKDVSKEDKKDEAFEVTDEMVTELKYDGETTLDGLKSKVKEALGNMKKEQFENAFTSEVIEEALKVADFELPQSMIEESAMRSEEDFKARLSKIKLDIDSYLKTQNTTLEEQRERWMEDAKKQIMMDLLLINLSVSENLTPTEEEVDAEVEKMQDEKLKAQYNNNPSNKNYLRTLMARERGIAKLLEIARSK